MNGKAPKRITRPAEAADATACVALHQGGNTAATGPLGRGAKVEASATANGTRVASIKMAEGSARMVRADKPTFR